MDSDEIFTHQELEAGFDIEKRNRRSSILKPRKSIGCPIDETNTEVFTSGKASRRVSFANINFIKPFASDPEKTTIWDNTYEEEVNHSDSSKSVDTLPQGLLNVTSISFPEFEDKEYVEKAPFQISESASSSKYIHYEIAQGVEECDKENVIPLVKTIVSKNETIIFERADSDMEFTSTYVDADFKVPASIVQFVKSRPSQNKSATSNSTNFEMELTCLLPNTKGVKRAETSCETLSKCPNDAKKNVTICSTDDMEFTIATDNSFSNNMEFTTIVADVKSLSSSRQLAQSNESARIGFPKGKEIDDMEFTTNLCDVKGGLQDHKVVDPNIPEAEMEFTCNLANLKPFLIREQETIQSAVENNSEEADMEFTTNLAIPQYFSGTTAIPTQPSVNNGSDDQMEYTTNLPNIKQMYGGRNFANEYSPDHLLLKPQQSVKSKIIAVPTEHISKEIDMEFTANLAKPKDFLSSVQTATAKTYQSNQLEKNQQKDQIECSLDLKSTKQVHNRTEEHKSEEIDMEFTTNLSVHKYSSNGVKTVTTEKQLEEKKPEGKLEMTTNLRNPKEVYNCSRKHNSEEIDMEFTANLAKPKDFSTSVQTSTVKTYQSNQLEKNEHKHQIECSLELKSTKQVYNCKDEHKSEEIDMEFTTNLAVHKYSSNGVKTVTTEKQLEEKKPEGKLEMTTNLRNPKEVYNHPRKHNSEEIDMEFTTNLAIYNQPSNAIPPVIAKSIHYNQPFVKDESEDMECTAIVPNAKQISSNFHDPPSRKTSQDNCTDTIQTALKIPSEGVGKEFTLSSAESSQQFGELKSEDTILRHNSPKELPSNNKLTVGNEDGQAVNGHESRAIGTKFSKDPMASKEVSGVVQTTSTEVVLQSSSNLTTEEPFRGRQLPRSPVQATIERNNSNVEYKEVDVSKKFALENPISGKDDTEEVLAIQNHKQAENYGLDEFKNREDNNILYSEQGNFLLNHAEYPPVFVNNAITPTTSFAMNFSNMSPCIEDTQQLIHATFSKPESFDLLLTGGKFQLKNISENKHDSKDVRGVSQLNDTSDNLKQILAEASQTKNPDILAQKSCWDLANSSNDILANVTPEIVDVDEDMSIEQCVLKNQEDSSAITEPSLDVSQENTCDSLDYQNYTMRSNRILNDIKKHLVYTQPDPFFEESIRRCERACDTYVDGKAWIKSFFENYRLPKIDVVDLKDFFKDESEDFSTSRMSDGLPNDEADGQKRLSMPHLAVPKTLYERVCEAAERSKKYWHFVKSENDFYHFDGLFGSIFFKAHLHPELGIVYSVETRNKLAEESSPLAHYEAKVFELKLSQDNLALALGPNFDIFSLLDYVCLCMDDIASFHKEFHQLLDKYGSSHKLTMHRDNRVTFEILHFHFIIWWTITIEMSVNNIGCKECISAKYNLKEKVAEDDIKQIAENCPKGVNFLRFFIEKVDEYIQRIGKKIAWQRESRMKYVYN